MQIGTSCLNLLLSKDIRCSFFFAWRSAQSDSRLPATQT